MCAVWWPSSVILSHICFNLTMVPRVIGGVKNKKIVKAFSLKSCDSGRGVSIIICSYLCLLLATYYILYVSKVSWSAQSSLAEIFHVKLVFSSTAAYCPFFVILWDYTKGMYTTRVTHGNKTNTWSMDLKNKTCNTEWIFFHIFFSLHHGKKIPTLV